MRASKGNFKFQQASTVTEKDYSRRGLLAAPSEVSPLRYRHFEYLRALLLHRLVPWRPSARVLNTMSNISGTFVPTPEQVAARQVAPGSV